MGTEKSNGKHNGKVATSGIVKPLPPEEIPEWSAETLKSFEGLTVLERKFVELYATGLNAAEAYRRITGAEYTDRESDLTRKNAYTISSRPRVKVAIANAMADAGFGARADREFLLQRLQIALMKAEASEDPKDQKTVAKIIETIAKIKGTIRTDEGTSGGDQRSNIRLRIFEIVAAAKGLDGRSKRESSSGHGSPVVRVTATPVDPPERPAGPGAGERS